MNKLSYLLLFLLVTNVYGYWLSTPTVHGGTEQYPYTAVILCTEGCYVRNIYCDDSDKDHTCSENLIERIKEHIVRVKTKTPSLWFAECIY